MTYVFSPDFPLSLINIHCFRMVYKVTEINACVCSTVESNNYKFQKILNIKINTFDTALVNVATNRKIFHFLC